jgi:hydrogenase maturation protease
MQNILILGIGNILQKDDGIGVHIVNQILETGIHIPDNVEVIDGGTAGFDLVPLIMGRDKVIVVDAVRVDDVPGSVYRFPLSYVHDTYSRYSLHTTGVRAIFNQAKLAGCDPLVEIIGVVPEDIQTLEIGISESLKP